MLKIFLLPVIGVTSFFVILFIFSKVFGPIPFAVNSVVTTKSDTFSVSGTGKVSATPDIASVTVGVAANGPTVKAAQDQLNNNINNVSEATKKLGIDAKDIQTTNYSISPNYDYKESSQRITGYSANTNIAIKVRKVDQVNSVIDAATQNGANQVGGVNFDTDNKSKLENEARQKAVDIAKKRAQDAAKIAGFKLGKIINYSENFGGGPIAIPFATRSLDIKESLQTQIEPGSSEVIVTINLSYEIQ